MCSISVQLKPEQSRISLENYSCALAVNKCTTIKKQSQKMHFNYNTIYGIYTYIYGIYKIL